jgi:hypothetical protein
MRFDGLGKMIFSYPQHHPWEDVIVTEIEQTESKIDASNPAAARAMEKVSLMGRRFRFEYVQQTPDGRPGGMPKAGWDCVQNSKV